MPIRTASSEHLITHRQARASNTSSFEGSGPCPRDGRTRLLPAPRPQQTHTVAQERPGPIPPLAQAAGDPSSSG